MQKMKRQILLIAIDFFIIQISMCISFYLRFDGLLLKEPAMPFVMTYLKWVIVITGIKIFVFAIFNMYNSLWRYASIEELIQVFFASLVGTLGLFAMLYFAQIPMPRSVIILSGVFDMLMLGASRFGYRSLRVFRDFTLKGIKKKSNDKLLIIGAGEAGALIAKEIKSQMDNNNRIAGFVDDDPAKLGRRINGMKVLGNRQSVVNIVEKYGVSEIIFAIPSSNKQTKQEILDICAKTQAKLKILPSLSEIIDGKLTVSAIRNVEIEDLLGRDEVTLSEMSHEAFFRRKVVMITGAGGSIGSEIVRQVLRFEPKQVILLDFYENNLYDLEQDLLRHYTKPPIVAIIGNIRERDCIDEVISSYKPHIIFHAAAHKHVPLMETSPKEAVRNNILGTYNVILAAQKYGVERLVQISTDKAVNPTNVMGATKRACEILIQTMNGLSKTELIAVRFGNVLGSEGSVIPLFKKQISEGGPVTVTHEDIIRYFMTIPEASRLVIQAGSLGKGGEIFVLDMGEPVRIYDLAEKMIRLSGFEPHTEIPIKITGLRPGEKLFEELLIDDVHTESTELHKIFIEKSNSVNWSDVKPKFDALYHTLDLGNVEVLNALKTLVETYQSQND